MYLVWKVGSQRSPPVGDGDPPGNLILFASQHLVLELKNMVLEPMQCIAKEGWDAHPRNPFHLFLWFCPLTELTSHNSTNTGIQQIIWQNSIWVSVKEARQTHKAVRMSVKWRRLLLKMDSLAGGFCAGTLPLKSLASGFVHLAGH